VGRQSVRHLPVGMYGAVMGLAGLGLACRGAASVLPVPVFFAEIWVVLGAAALALLLPAYLVKLARHPGAVREEFVHPAQLGFCGALPVGITLVAGGLAPYAPAAASVLWWAGASLLFLFQVWALRLFLGGNIPIAEVNGGWLIVMVGGIVVPGPALALGLAQPSAFLFGLSAMVAPVIVALVFYRTVAFAPLPPVLRPTWFIFLVPPSLIFANGVALSGGASLFLNGLFYLALALTPALLLAARHFLRWPFAASWWAFTFPLDALATAAVQYALIHPSPLWRTVAALALALAVAAVVLVLAKTVAALARGTLLAAPRAAAPADRRTPA
jgi:tellurite resistance protein